MRHGEVVLERRKKITSREFPDWIKSYNGATVLPDPGKWGILNGTDAIVCSSLRRSVDSAGLAGQKPLESNTLFDEAGLPYSPSSLFRLTPNCWAVIFRLLWLFGYSKNSESMNEAKKRARSAAFRLDEISQKHGTVLLVGHGVMNRLIGRSLVKQGWRNTKKLPNTHWGYGIFEKKE